MSKEWYMIKYLFSENPGYLKKKKKKKRIMQHNMSTVM